MYGVMLAIASAPHALSAVALNRVAITVVEIVLAVVGGFVLSRRSGEDAANGRPPAAQERFDLGG
ncbi:MAG TPA: hypothetical protein VHD91_10905, partial [Gaiellaceae bacterium]|nr:hypothetical protein [Gaiellaceae bacterium]